MPPKPARVASAAATVPQPWQILGTPLRPFSLGHHLLLRKMGLPFAGNSEADCGPEDVLLGVAVCAADPLEAMEAFLAGDWPQIFKRWRARLRGPWWRRNKLNLWRAEVMFREYLKEGYALPPVWRRRSENALEMTSVWPELLKCRLVLAGFSERDILTGYLPARWYDYFTVLEINMAKECKDAKNWRRIFYTAEHHEQLKAVDGQEVEHGE